MCFCVCFRYWFEVGGDQLKKDDVMFCACLNQSELRVNLNQNVMTVVGLFAAVYLISLNHTHVTLNKQQLEMLSSKDCL